ncbi:caspase-1 isoform X2 [Eurytemora carolleeae]|nr:caspase-1 isoform X2 [Eurytemora carolleeae]|eukprot:XP_023343737.1 caspase-1-like isoform X2 [Eurytemora affinis]
MPTEKDDHLYNMNHRRRGKAFVFNHMNFDPKLQLRARNGTHNDRDNLRIVLRQLDFEVEVHNDLPYKEIERILEQASMEDHSDADCILVTVLSHGELGILYASDHPYKPENLWTHFTADKCPSLAGKPKMFFIQACQGDRLDSGVKMVSRTQTDAGAASYKIPSHADFLIGYSTIPGFYSWRNTTAGSWFIQALCHVLQREGNSRDLLSLLTRYTRGGVQALCHVLQMKGNSRNLLSMLTRVCRKVAFDFQSNVPGDFVMHDKKQIPCITTMLTRDVVFHRK